MKLVRKIHGSDKKNTVALALALMGFHRSNTVIPLTLGVSAPFGLPVYCSSDPYNRTSTNFRTHGNLLCGNRCNISGILFVTEIYQILELIIDPTGYSDS